MIAMFQLKEHRSDSVTTDLLRSDGASGQNDSTRLCFRSGGRPGVEETRPTIVREATLSLSEILNLTVLVSDNHRVPRIDYRQVERTIVFTLE
jgi:hypothetical protein